MYPGACQDAADRSKEREGRGQAQAGGWKKGKDMNRYYQIVCTANWPAWRCESGRISAPSEREVLDRAEKEGWLLASQSSICPVHLAAMVGVERREEIEEVFAEINHALDLPEELKLRTVISERGGLKVGDTVRMKFVRNPDQLIADLQKQIERLSDSLPPEKREEKLEDVWIVIGMYTE